MKTSYKEITPKGEEFRLQLNGLDFALEKKLYKKLILMSKRIIKEHPKYDACVINDGYEGEGKTNASLVEAIVAQYLIGDISIHLFFKTSSCIEFAKRTERKIIILDEPSLESLARDGTTLNKDFLRLVTTMRKKRHFFIINFAKFWIFPDFLVIDRALGMVHIDSRQGKDPGRFVYIRKKNLEKLWNAKKKSNKRLYKKLKSFGGRLPYLMEDIFDKFEIQVEGTKNATMQDYDDEKDKAIESIGEIKKSKREIVAEKRYRNMKKKVADLPAKLHVTQKELAAALGVMPRRLAEWKELELEKI